MTSSSTRLPGLLFLLAGCGGDASGGDAGPRPIDAGGGIDSGIDADTADGGGGLPDGNTIDATIDGGAFPCTRWQQVDNGGESADGSVRFALVRFFCVEAPQGWAFAGGCPVTAERFELTFGGSTYVADRPEQLAYEMSHHHGNDAVTATLPDRRLHWRIAWDIGGDTGFHHYVRAVDLDGTELLPETEILPTSCSAGPPLCAYGSCPD
jgi:hypothetical protein